MWQLLPSSGQRRVKGGHSGCEEMSLGRCNLIITTKCQQQRWGEKVTDEAAKILCKLQKQELSGNKNKYYLWKTVQNLTEVLHCFAADVLELLAISHQICLV